MAETPKYPPSSALKTVKKDLKKDKLKVPELDKTTEKHRDQMALVELRSALDPYIKDWDAAKLGMDLIERGVKIDGVGAGEILAGMRTGPEGFDKYTTKGFYGMMMSSEDYSDTRDPRYSVFATTEDINRRIPGFEKILQKQGIESLLPPEEGSTIYYDTGWEPEQVGTFPSGRPKYDTKEAQGKALSVLAEELAHLGMRYIQKEKGRFTNLPLDDEETMMNYQQGRAAANEGVYAMENAKRAYEFYNLPGLSRSKKEFEAIDRASREALQERGIGVKPAEPGIMEKLLGMFK